MAKKATSRRARGAPQLSEADIEAVSLPCVDEDHPPFALKLIDAAGGMVFPHAFVRTTSWNWDGCGGRTDLHEIYGLLWATVLRARGVASAGFVDDGGFGSPTEIYSRSLLFMQPFDRFFEASNVSRKDTLKANSAAAAHDLYLALGLEDPEQFPPEWQEENLPWLDVIRKHFGGEDEGELFVERINPDWRYYTSPKNFISVLELPSTSMVQLRYACRFYRPTSHIEGNRLVITAGGMHHAIAKDALRKGERVLQALDDSTLTKVGDGSAQWDHNAAMVIPLENRFVIIGGQFLISVSSLCGYRQYLSARGRWEEKNRIAASVFGQAGTIEWREPIDSARFADLAEALLKVEPGVIRVRSSGPHNEPDQGRDIIVDRAGVTLMEGHAATGVERETVQVKVRNKTIGKQDVRDIRDTIEHHRSKRYLLIAYPHISGALISHMEGLESKGYIVDWWTRTQIEEKLRKNPHILAQFTDLINHHLPELGR